MTTAALVLLIAVWFVACGVTKRWPLEVLVRACIRLQAEVIWIQEYAAPAVVRSRRQMLWCRTEAHRRAK